MPIRKEGNYGEKDKRGANVSRRDFLRTLGAVGGSLALMAYLRDRPLLK